MDKPDYSDDPTAEAVHSRDGAENAPLSYLMDMDGVLVHEGAPLDGAAQFIASLREGGHPYLLFTNNSRFTPRDLSVRLSRSGIDVEPEHIWTSALATAKFLASQRPGGTAHVIGEAGLTTALHDAGYVLTDDEPDYVVVGETRAYSFSSITQAIRLIRDGARLIATNSDVVGPSAQGPIPATGAVTALIEEAAGVDAYAVGKPNPLMMRSALRRLDAHSERTTMIGDRMDTDVRAGLETGLSTVLVLSGVTDSSEVDRYPYRPNRVVDSVADVDPADPLA